MRKIILGMGAVLMGVAMLVRAETPVMPAIIQEKLDKLTKAVAELIVKDVADKVAREKLTQPLELEVALAVGKLNELAIANEITMKDAVGATEGFARLWSMLDKWKSGVKEESKIA